MIPTMAPNVVLHRIPIFATNVLVANKPDWLGSEPNFVVGHVKFAGGKKQASVLSSQSKI